MIPQQRVMALMAHLIAHEGVDPDAIERAVLAAKDVRVGESIVEKVVGPDYAGPVVLVRSFTMEQASFLLR